MLWPDIKSTILKKQNNSSKVRIVGEQKFVPQLDIHPSNTCAMLMEAAYLVTLLEVSRHGSREPARTSYK